MNNKGFTLIELILVIAIIALLSLIFTPNVINLINKNKVNAYNATIDTVITAAKNYVSENRYNDVILTKVKDCEPFDISLDDLVGSGDLSKMPIDACTNAEFEENEKNVTVTFNCNTKEFSYNFLSKKNNC